MPDQEMIERCEEVARLAIYSDNKSVRDAVIAVFEAMREPTERMINTANFVHRSDAIDCWNRFIDSILNA